MELIQAPDSNILDPDCKFECWLFFAISCKGKQHTAAFSER